MQRTQKIKVLIVDDEEDFCHVLSAFLKKRGFEAIFAHTLESGLRFIQKNKPHILFLDNHLPDGRGWEHTEPLLQGNPSMKIILISAFKDKSPVPANQKVVILEKPLSLSQVDALLRS